jgi:hypothetical protein
LAGRALALARSGNPDVVIYDYVGFGSRDDLAHTRSASSALLGIDPTDVSALLSLGAYAWTKLIRRKHLRALGIQFPPGLTYEDLPFHWELLTQTDRVALLTERLCFYRQRSGSIVRRTDESRADHILAYDLIERSLRKHALYARHRDVFIRQRLRSFRVVYDTIAPAHRDAVRAMVRERMDADHWHAASYDLLLDRTTRDFLLALRGERGASLRRATWLAVRWLYRTLVPSGGTRTP